MTKQKLDYGSGSKPRKGFYTSDFTGAPFLDYQIEDLIVKEAADRSFDVIWCRNVIHHIPVHRLDDLFAEFDRLLKRGGYLIISEPLAENRMRNLILDVIWYRFLVQDFSISLPDPNVDFRDYLPGNYKISRTYLEKGNNEVVILEKVSEVISFPTPIVFQQERQLKSAK
jgi:SAM-dependent methyltransferase